MDALGRPHTSRTLRGLDDSHRVIRHSIDDGPEAVARDLVANYIREVTVLSSVQLRKRGEGRSARPVYGI